MTRYEESLQLTDATLFGFVLAALLGLDALKTEFIL